MTTVAEILQSATTALRTAQDNTRTDEEITHNARFEAETLLLAITQWHRTRLLTSLSDPVPDDVAQAFDAAVARRAGGEPLQYILGRAPFYGRDFVVRPGCLIPRPETEVLADTAVAWIRQHRPSATVLDVGTGSGILAITIALECPHTTTHTIDLSEQALAVARDNAAILAAPVTFHHGDGLDMLAATATAKGAGIAGTSSSAASGGGRGDDPDLVPGTNAGAGWNVIVSNPPYIPTEEISTLSEEVRRYEPHLALNGGTDGLDYYRAISALGDSVFACGPAAIIFEVGDTQAEPVARMYRESALWQGWNFHIVRDLRGFGRVVWGERL